MSENKETRVTFEMIYPRISEKRVLSEPEIKLLRKYIYQTYSSEQPSARDFQVFYPRVPQFDCPESVDLSEFAYVCTMKANNEEDLFFRMQADNWSPRGEAYNLITSLKLRHTSMSVGDLIWDSRTKVFKCVDSFGFKEVSLNVGCFTFVAGTQLDISGEWL